MRTCCILQFLGQFRLEGNEYRIEFGSYQSSREKGLHAEITTAWSRRKNNKQVYIV